MNVPISRNCDRGFIKLREHCGCSLCSNVHLLSHYFKCCVAVEVRTYIWVFRSIPSISMSIFMQALGYCYDYISIVCLEMKSADISNSVFSVQVCFGYPGPLHFHIKCKISTYVKNCIGILVAIVLNL